MHSSFSTTTLLVAVTLLLIAFFAFLNAAALPDVKRKEAVIRSLEQQFVGKHIRVPERRQNANQDTSGTATSAAGRGFSSRISELTALFQTQGFEQKQLNNQLLVVLPDENVFNPGDDQIKAEFLKVMSKLAADAKAAALDVEIHYLAPGNVGAQQEQEDALAQGAARAVSLYRYCIDSGIPAERLTAAAMLRQEPAVTGPSAFPQRSRIELRFQITDQQEAVSK